tara:strand:+ start:511 stop:648 length:138 start_codon:yes stop_codon:yes gene_type:complete
VTTIGLEKADADEILGKIFWKVLLAIPEIPSTRPSTIFPKGRIKN